MLSQFIQTGDFFLVLLFCGVGLEWVHLVRRPLLCPDDRLIWSIWWSKEWQEKPKYSEETCTSTILSTTNPTLFDLSSNPGRRCRKPATDWFSYGTDFRTELQYSVHCWALDVGSCVRRWMTNFSLSWWRMVFSFPYIQSTFNKMSVLTSATPYFASFMMFRQFPVEQLSYVLWGRIFHGH
jgi:hypothetical protein